MERNRVIVVARPNGGQEQISRALALLSLACVARVKLWGKCAYEHHPFVKLKVIHVGAGDIFRSGSRGPGC
jgi:hypothetical protein